MSDGSKTDGAEAAAVSGDVGANAASGASAGASDAAAGEANDAGGFAAAVKAGADGSSRTTEHAQAQAAGHAAVKPATARVLNRPSPMRPMEHPGAAAGSEAAAKLTPVQRALVARGDRRELLDFLRRRRGA
jgi:hypothetical protein